MRTEIFFDTEQEMRKGCPKCQSKDLKAIAWNMEQDKIECNSCDWSKIVDLNLSGVYISDSRQGDLNQDYGYVQQVSEPKNYIERSLKIFRERIATHG